MLYFHGFGHFHPENQIDNAFLESLDIGTTSHREATASMTMAVKAGTGSKTDTTAANAVDGKAAVILISRFVPGTRLRVFVDRARPDRVLIDWNAQV